MASYYCDVFSKNDTLVTLASGRPILKASDIPGMAAFLEDGNNKENEKLTEKGVDGNSSIEVTFIGFNSFITKVRTEPEGDMVPVLFAGQVHGDEKKITLATLL